MIETDCTARNPRMETKAAKTAAATAGCCLNQLGEIKTLRSDSEPDTVRHIYLQQPQYTKENVFSSAVSETAPPSRGQTWYCIPGQQRLVKLIKGSEYRSVVGVIGSGFNTAV